jgi:dolichol-phosphate mannosyltransferase
VSDSTPTGRVLSVAVPIFNEVETIRELHRRLSEVAAGVGPHELVFVDDGSTDGSWDELVGVAAADPNVRLVRLSRNFGHQVALTAALEAARGDMIVSLDGDLQDPPEVIPRLVERFDEGCDVVFAVRTRRAGETRFKLATASLFYRGIDRMSATSIPAQAGDFRLLSRRALDALLAMPERARFLRGMTSWIGFRQGTVEYERDARYAGTTKYPLRRMVRFASDAVTSFSTTPIRAVVALGFATVLLCAAALVWTLYLRLFTDETVQGWTSVIVVVLFLGGVQLLSLGIIGQYVGRIFDEVKGRPLYVVAEVVDQDRPGA